MVEPAQDWLCPNAPDRLDSPCDRRVLVQRQMSARAVVVFHVRQQNVPQVPLPDDHDVVEAFPADRANQPLRTAILPRRSWGDRLVTDAQRSHTTDEYLAVASISITDQMVWRWLPAAGFQELVSEPLCGRMRGHSNPKDLSSMGSLSLSIGTATNDRAPATFTSAVIEGWSST